MKFRVHVNKFWSIIYFYKRPQFYITEKYRHFVFKKNQIIFYQLVRHKIEKKTINLILIKSNQ